MLSRKRTISHHVIMLVGLLGIALLGVSLAQVVSAGPYEDTINAERRENLKTCLSGKYPSLCRHNLLSSQEAQQVSAAEREENLTTCLSGKYPSLCKHNLLSSQEAQQVSAAERRENLTTCLSGKYPSLCSHNLLSPQEAQQVDAAERRENLTTCLSGKYPSLCRQDLLEPKGKPLAVTEPTANRPSSNQSAPTITPKPTPSSPPKIASVGQSASTGSTKIAVPMVKEGRTFSVPVLINNTITLKFLVDSGASDVSVPADVVSTLLRTGTLTDSDFLGLQTYTLADGSKVPSQTFRIRSLKVGDRVMENVTGSVAGVNGSLLLGQSFLGRFKSWSINNADHTLVLE